MNGDDIIREVRTWTSTPIIVISARTAEKDKVRSLDLGADDYITKPFGTSELLARIRASLRHSNRLRTNDTLYVRPYRHGGMVLDFSKRLLTIDGGEIHLTPIEYKIVACLAQNSGKVITYASILSDVWGPYADSDNKILRVNMANIRGRSKPTRRSQNTSSQKSESDTVWRRMKRMGPPFPDITENDIQKNGQPERLTVFCIS